MLNRACRLEATEANTSISAGYQQNVNNIFTGELTGLQIEIEAVEVDEQKGENAAQRQYQT